MPRCNVLRGRASNNCGNCRAVKRRGCGVPYFLLVFLRFVKAHVVPLYSAAYDVPIVDNVFDCAKSAPGIEMSGISHSVVPWPIQPYHQRSSEKRSQSRVVRTNAWPRPTREYRFSLTVDEIGINLFLCNFVIGAQSPSRGRLNYVPTVRRADGEYPKFVANIAAVGLVALANPT